MNFNFDIGLIDTIQTIDCSELPPLGGTAGVLTIDGTGAILLTSGDTSQRPTGVAGMFRFNTDTNTLEYFDGSTWDTLSQSTSTVSSVAAHSNSAGLAISGSPINTSGTFQFTLSNSLEALSDLGAGSGTGLIAQTGINTFTDVTIQGTSGNISVTNGSGVAGNPTIDLVNAGTPVSNSFVKITTDTKGRVTATSAVGSSDITTSLGYTPVNKAGDTNIGSLSMASNASITFNGGTVTGVPTPSNATDVVNKSYVDGLAGGITAKAAVRVSTTTNLSVTGAGSQTTHTLTANSNGAIVIDGQTLNTGDRVLVKNQTTASDNGVYTVTATGDVSNPFVLTRAEDFTGVAPGSVAAGDFVFVEDGNTLASTGWVIYVVGNVSIVVDTDDINWTQFTGVGAVTLNFAGDSGTPDVLVSGNTLHIVGTSNQISTFADGSNNITISLPQDIATTSSPEFLTIKLSDLDASSIVFTDASNNLISQSLTDGQVFIGSSTGAPGAATLTASTGISITNGSNSITITNTGVTSLAGTTNQITVSASTGAVTLSLPSTIAVTNINVSSLTQHGILFAGASGVITSTASPTNGQLLVGSTGNNPVLATLTAGTGISVTNGTGSITVANTGVTSVALSDGSTAPIYTISGSPVTTTGTLTFTLNSQAAHKIFAGPSSGSNAQPTFRSLVYSDLPIQLYAENPSTPPATTATGANSVALAGGTASADNSFAVGQGSNASIYGADVFANGSFATAGDAQGGTYVLRAETTDNTTTELFLDGANATQRLIFSNNTVVTFNIMVASRRTDDIGGGAGYSFIGVIRKDATTGSNTIVGAVSKTVIGETNTPWDAAVSADTVTGALKIAVTGEVSKTIRWVAVVRTTEVSN